MITVVAGAVYRGPQPTGVDWTCIVAAGVKTVLKLNYDDEGSDDNAICAGLRLIEVPMPPRDFAQAVGAPDEADVQRAVAELCDEANWPILVHCRHGMDRTGLVVGEFRVIKQKWDLHQAFLEMLEHGFHWELPDLMMTWLAFASGTGFSRCS